MESKSTEELPKSDVAKRVVTPKQKYFVPNVGELSKTEVEKLTDSDESEVSEDGNK